MESCILLTFLLHSYEVNHTHIADGTGRKGGVTRRYNYEKSFK